MFIGLIIGGVLVVGALLLLFLSGKEVKPLPTAEPEGPSLPQKLPPLTIPSPEVTSAPLTAPGRPLPFGIKFLLFINWLGIILDLIGIIIPLVLLPMVTRKATQAGIEAPAPWFITLLFAGSFIFPAILFFVTRGLHRRQNWARIIQIIFSFIGLFLFPIGTVLAGVSLYFLLIDPDTTEAFRSPQKYSRS